MIMKQSYQISFHPYSLISFHSFFFSTNKQLFAIYVAGSAIEAMCNEGVIQAVESTLQLYGKGIRSDIRLHPTNPNLLWD